MHVHALMLPMPVAKCELVCDVNSYNHIHPYAYQWVLPVVTGVGARSTVFGHPGWRTAEVWWVCLYTGSLGGCRK